MTKRSQETEIKATQREKHKMNTKSKNTTTKLAELLLLFIAFLGVYIGYQVSSNIRNANLLQFETSQLHQNQNIDLAGC